MGGIQELAASRSLKLGHDGWSFTLYPDAREAVCQFVGGRRETWTPGNDVPGDPERSRREAARRAATRVRRYCASNGLDRLWTLTYRGEGCYDLDAMVSHVGAFWRDIRERLGGKPMPYLWVPEWHPDGHGLHVHAAAGQFVHWSKIGGAWPHGNVHVERIVSRGGPGSVDHARQAARYLAKYVAKATDGTVDFGRHRYEVAQGFAPRRLYFEGMTEHGLLAQACAAMGSGPSSWWSSDDSPDWEAAPTRTYQW